MSKFQAPKGTRDFFPEDMAVRRHLEGIWRKVSIDHGFDEVDGPTFEHLDLYTLKSGDEIVSQLFSFRRAGGDTDYALRPEFTPTLARMVAARGSSLSMPLRWFSMPNMFRAERPQRGRLREHVQFNADIIGTLDPAADADLVALAADLLARLGLGPEDVRIKLSHRDAVRRILEHLGVDRDRLPAAYALLDRRDKMSPEEFARQAGELGLEAESVARLNEVARIVEPMGGGGGRAARAGGAGGAFTDLAALREALPDPSLAAWCEYDLGIVRGLAYYTGTVFEIHEAAGKERAIAGGGRYDQLVELVGGPSTPAVGFAMGDVVIRLVLEERGLLDPPGAYAAAPDLFVIAASDDAARGLRTWVARWRRAGLHVRHSSRTTRNVGKLLGEAGRTRARFAVILGDEVGEGRGELKDLSSGDQASVALTDIPNLASASPSCAS
jgi:histidyl-tRNA synthetase